LLSREISSFAGFSCSFYSKEDFMEEWEAMEAEFAVYFEASIQVLWLVLELS